MGQGLEGDEKGAADVAVLVAEAEIEGGFVSVQSVAEIARDFDEVFELTLGVVAVLVGPVVVLVALSGAVFVAGVHVAVGLVAAFVVVAPLVALLVPLLAALEGLLVVAPLVAVLVVLVAFVAAFVVLLVALVVALVVVVVVVVVVALVAVKLFELVSEVSVVLVVFVVVVVVVLVVLAVVVVVVHWDGVSCFVVAVNFSVGLEHRHSCALHEDQLRELNVPFVAETARGSEEGED